MDNKDKVINLFRYIKELYALKYQVVNNILEQEWVKFISNIPDDDANIFVNYMDRTEGDNDEDVSEIVLLQVSKPEFTAPPALPTELEGWIKIGWDRFNQPFEKITVKNIDDLTAVDSHVNDNLIPNRDLFNTEYFDDEKIRVEAFNKYSKIRYLWVEKQNKILKTRNLFNDLYSKYIDLERESEVIEMMVGQGVLSCNAECNRAIKHPILLKKVSMRFDALNNVIRIVDTDSNPEIYTPMLQGIDFINHTVVKELKEQLCQEYYHPLDRNDTPDFLKILAHKLHSKSIYIDEERASFLEDVKLVICNNPVFFIRKRTNGVIKAIDEIITQIEVSGEVSTPLLNLIGAKSLIIEGLENEDDVNNNLSVVNGEDANILLSKEANREQLEIAKRIENYTAVLVQGPPGTGKTHTIANLMGHFLAQGKNILVTSHTKKALSVVKEKVARKLQNLCVSILDENSRDMERSVDGISEYLSSHSSIDLLYDIDRLKCHRDKILKNLDLVRKKIYNIRHKEFQTVVFGGNSFSLSQAAKFVCDNREGLSSVISGKVLINKSFPIISEDLSLVYKTNDIISVSDEQELKVNLPNPNQLLSPNELLSIFETEESIIKESINIQNKLNVNVYIDYVACTVSFDGKSICCILDRDSIADLKLYLLESKLDQSKLDNWCYHAILAGKRGGGYKKVWDQLIQSIADACSYASSTVDLLLGKEIKGDFEKSAQTTLILEEIRSYLQGGGKLNFLSLFRHRSWKELYKHIVIDGHAIESASDCEVLIGVCKLAIKRDQISVLWAELIEKYGGIGYSDLGDEPEQSANSYVGRMKNCIKWYEATYSIVRDKIRDANIESDILFNNRDSNTLDDVKSDVEIIYSQLSLYLDIIDNIYIRLSDLRENLNKTKSILQAESLKHSSLCNKLLSSIDSKDVNSYGLLHNEFCELYNKYHYTCERERILKELSTYAPDWSDAIRNRIGIHGRGAVPDNILDAWKWKQFAGVVNMVTSMPFEELQYRSVSLSKELREITAELAEKQAWNHLLSRVENDVAQKQALQGWKLTVKKIGKGTGKAAPALRRQAQKLMSKCQSAVPAWIMPINRALESLDPQTNKFDVVIIDEASQSDISSLAIIYLAKKIIIVGDDQQVSPSAVGIDTSRIAHLAEMYIKDVIPNAHLYDMKSSIYDIAKTTFQTLMLKEHFRCVPDIIGYSNRLCYDYKIKPLRDDSSVSVKPSTIAYRVKDGMRQGRCKVNEKEAEMVVALMLACMEFKEYDGMTFGAISLLGDEQAIKINTLAIDKIKPVDFKNRKILCGNASHFQGDERDVVFISLVDNNEGDIPLRLTGSGVGDSIKQRYNVAVSRAKNQLWVIHSLDITTDLKSGDMRRDLIEYVSDPNSFRQQLIEIESKADSPFEVAVVKALKLCGYHIVQQWRVGSYRIDMVAIYGDKKIAIECDGELYHSGYDKISQDMERQTILERLGWRFIRIRGSEYYRNPKEIIDSVVGKLADYGIEPESEVVESCGANQLKEDVIIRAEQILNKWEEEKNVEDIEFYR